MIYFMTRVELLGKEGKNIDQKEYWILDEEMTKNRFQQSILVDNKKGYHLPIGEYVKTVEDTDKATVLNDAKSACEETMKQCDTIDNYRVLVTEGSAIAAFNLKKVESTIKTGNESK